MHPHCHRRACSCSSRSGAGSRTGAVPVPVPVSRTVTGACIRTATRLHIRTATATGARARAVPEWYRQPRRRTHPHCPPAHARTRTGAVPAVVRGPCRYPCLCPAPSPAHASALPSARVLVLVPERCRQSYGGRAGTRACVPHRHRRTHPHCPPAHAYPYRSDTGTSAVPAPAPAYTSAPPPARTLVPVPGPVLASVPPPVLAPALAPGTGTHQSAVPAPPPGLAAARAHASSPPAFELHRPSCSRRTCTAPSPMSAPLRPRILAVALGWLGVATRGAAICPALVSAGPARTTDLGAAWSSKRGRRAAPSNCRTLYLTYDDQKPKCRTVGAVRHFGCGQSRVLWTTAAVPRPVR
ncbi:hypothetical protein C8E87_4743 [Paractinoplanes brasiliensis]|uniref:Uncharacterized protein n=1 Tax=Paractinoplanes brasiliensis TaxID=52695 RepID=A0A4R6JXD6_9ACTN|nr:hypothetical protein C8E87_4743 [Actinoplanes brasiliensis]